MEKGHKYDRYVVDITTQYPGYPEQGHHGAWIAKINGDNFPGCNEYLPHWVVPETMEHTLELQRGVGHPPHVHKENELIFLIGSDPYHPEELGGVCTMSFGEEMEEHIITRTSLLFIPAGLPHGFYQVLSCEKPFIFFRVHQAPHLTTRARRDLMTQDQIDRVWSWENFRDIGFEEEEYWDSRAD